MGAALEDVIDHGRIVVCAGSGGVGKTTTAAALALAAARGGRRVLALTIDPAQRLARSLGLADNPSTPHAIDLAPGTAGTLHVLVHDPKRTFDELVREHAPSAVAAARILQNPMYDHLSTRLAGVGEYMAMEKLLALRDSQSFDLIVLDTPPTRNALDFLTAPERMTEALSSGAARLIVKAFAAPGSSPQGMFRRGMARALRGIGKLSSNAFLEDFATLLAQLDELFAGFQERSQRVARVLRSAEVSYLVVSCPEPLGLQEARFFLEHLERHGMGPGLLLLNRVRETVAAAPIAGVVRELERLGVELGPNAQARLGQALDQERAWAELDAQRTEQARALVPSGRLLLLPELQADLHELGGLLRLSDLLANRA